jgi:hypothetical protein
MKVSMATKLNIYKECVVCSSVRVQNVAGYKDKPHGTCEHL